MQRQRRSAGGARPLFAAGWLIGTLCAAGASATADAPPRAKFGYYPSHRMLRVHLQGNLLRTGDGQTGLRAAYFNNRKLDGEPALKRTDETVAFHWNRRSPAEGVNKDGFSARWTGRFGPVPQSGLYQFRTLNDDGVRLWVNGELLIDDWDGAARPVRNAGRIRLERGQSYKVRLEYFDRGREAVCRLETALLRPEAEPTRSARITVRRKDAPEGEKPVAEQKVRWAVAGSEHRLDVGELDEGTYTATVHVDGRNEPIRHTFRRKHFVWEGNQLGVTEKVYPPFEPVSIDGRETSVVMRRYRKTGLGLWESVEARANESGFRQMLAGPITLRTADGAALEGDGKFTETGSQRAVYEGRADHPAVRVQTRTETEYDGCMRVELTLRPGKKQRKLKGLRLDIPLRDEMAPLWHAVGTGLRQNPAGHTPEGSGNIWDSTQFPDYDWPPDFKPLSFVPYIWLGGEERGLCWFADTDRGWVLDRGDDGRYAPCVSLHRKNGELTLRVHLVQRPVALDEPRTITFGLMATPAKPMRDGWRRIGFNRNYNGHPTITWMGSTYWGAAQTMREAYPLGRDFSVLDKIQEARLVGGKPGEKAFWRAWSSRHLTDYEPQGRKSKDEIHRLVRHAIGRGRSAHGPGYQNVYWEEHFSKSRFHPATQVYRDEWDAYFGQAGFHVMDTPHRPADFPARAGAADSYIDFQCWYGAEFIRRGIGLYFDNAFPKLAYNPITTPAYRHEDGTIHPSAGIWWQRRYFKRIWVLHQQLAPAATKPIMMFHMTNTHVAPFMSFGQSNLDLEWKYGPKPTQAKFAPDLLRAESTGLQTGNIPLALATIKGAESDKQKQRLRRAKLGALMVHEIRFRARGAAHTLMQRLYAFGYGRPGCRVYNYWDPDDPVSAGDERNVKTLLLERDGKLLLLVVTWNPDPATARLSLDGAAIDADVSRASDAETGEKLPFSDGTITAELSGYGVRLIALE